MRVAFFTDNYRPLVGGIESSIASFEAALRKLGHQIFVVCPSYPGVRDETGNVIRLRSINSGIRLPGLAANFRPHALLPWVPDVLKQLRVDIVHAQTPGTVGILADMFARRHQVPLVYTFHTFASKQVEHADVRVRLVASAANRLLPVYQRLTRRLSQAPSPATSGTCQERVWAFLLAFANLADAVVAPSQHVATTLTERGLSGVVHVVPSGVDTAFYRLKHDLPPDLAPLWHDHNSITLISLGRLAPEKRPLALIRAVSLLSSDNKCRLLFVGEGIERTAAADLAQRLGVSDKVVFAGIQEGARKAALLQRSNGFILASNGFETQGLAIIEAISAGLPVIYCDGRLRDGVSPETAILTDPSPAGLAGGIEEFLRDAARRKRMADAARRLSHDFDSLLQGRKMVEIYEETLRRYGQPSGRHCQAQRSSGSADSGRPSQLEPNTMTTSNRPPTV